MLNLKSVLSAAVIVTAGYLSASDIPSTVRGTYYPVYYNYLPPTTPGIPLNEVNMVFVAFTVVYFDDNSVDPNGQHLDPNTVSLGGHNPVLGYENCRGNWPDKYGTINKNDSDHERIMAIADAAHKIDSNTKVLVTLGYGTDYRGSVGSVAKTKETPWDRLSNPSQYDNFAKQTVTFLKDNHLDGFDIDFEVVNTSQSNFVDFCRIMSQELHKAGLLFTITPAVGCGNIPDLSKDEVMSYFDLVNDQSYYNPSSDYYIKDCGVKSTNIVIGASHDGSGDDFKGIAETYNQSLSTSNPLRGVFYWNFQEDKECHNPPFEATDYNYENVK